MSYPGYPHTGQPYLTANPSSFQQPDSYRQPQPGAPPYPASGPGHQQPASPYNYAQAGQYAPPVTSPYLSSPGGQGHHGAQPAYPFQQHQQPGGTAAYPYYPNQGQSASTGILAGPAESGYRSVSPYQPIHSPAGSIHSVAYPPYSAEYHSPSIAHHGQSPVPAHYYPSADSVPSSAAPIAPVPSTKVTLRIPRPATTADTSLIMPTRASRSSGGPSIVLPPNPPIHQGYSARPTRGASQRATQQLHLQAEEEERDDDDFGLPEDDGTQEEEYTGLPQQGPPPAIAHLGIGVGEEGMRRSSRDRKPVHHFADVEFETKPQDTSPIRQRSSKKAGRRIDPDSEDDEADGDYVGGGRAVPPRNKFPPKPATRLSLSAGGAGAAGPSYTHSNGLPLGVNGHALGTRSTRSKPAGHTPRGKTGGRGGGSSGDSAFNPDAASEAEDEEEEQSDDPLGADYVEDRRGRDEDEETDDLESRTPSPSPARRRSRRVKRSSRAVASLSTAPAGRSGLRRSTRATARQESEDDEEEYGATKRTLRARVPVNYQLPPADISTEIRQAELMEGIAAASRPNGAARARFAGTGASGLGGGGGGGGGNRGRAKGLGWLGGLGLGGKDLARAMRDPDTSDSDDLMPPPIASAGTSAAAAGTSGQAGLVGGSKIAAPTDIKDFGRINPKSSMADADPLGVDMNVTFDNVGGLDGHIDQLKEMVALPLLYPEVFQQFGITPPRGVLFHGPPGTGKTLLARALAASCSNGNTKIAFFMRKGADVLSKWVGEAERQLRMLFEEARAAQPSIIFFDEIDGLAPVRSSKQDQIHASLVSTLLALMDGMDGRGQVIVIGATNRPDSVDPALRRPGRFDREFYFPLPNKEARKKIIQINTRAWTPRLEEGMVEMLAGMTKGYGGADMRALCTEAALNAIQRRYPQIYRSTDRFELDTSSITVKAKDFLMAVKKIVPSSARSTTSTAIPLPTHLVPLLSDPLDRLKSAVDAALPRHKSRTALEEAMWEDDDGEEAGAEMLQTLDKMRTYRPRVLVSGSSGMGQTYLGPAILHHFEGFHVQNFDLGVLLSDSARTVEAALVQLFIEAKRHQPSIIYIPGLVAWSNTLSDSAKATFKSLLDGTLPSEPVLLLGVAESGEVGADVRGWFGWGEESEVELLPPGEDARAEYFTPLITHLQTPPNMWPDALPRRPRELEILPLAKPLPPRKPTDAELARERERDINARNMMVLSFTGLVSEFARKYKRVVASVKEDAYLLHSALVQHAAESQAAEAAVPDVEIIPPAQATPLPNGTRSLPIIDGTIVIDDDVGMLSASQPAAVTHASPSRVLPDQMLRNVHTPSLARPPEANGLSERSQGPSDIEEVDLVTSGSNDLADLFANDAPGPPVASTSTLAVDVPEPTPAPAPAPSGPDWTPYDIDVDLLSRKLAKHKYHRPADFLADIDKIKSNADRLGDADRQTKVAELVSHAYLHVAEFDPRWAPEFEAYAERMRTRRAERVSARAVEVAPGTASEREAGQEQTGQPQPVLTTAAAAVPSALTVDHTTAQTERGGRAGSAGLKRPREDGDVDMANDGGSSSAAIGQPEKRARLDAADATVPPPLSTPAARTYPPFVVPLDKLEVLTQALRLDTAGWSVEQLEQLRAGVFDRIWRKRAEWDRSAVIDELQAFLGKVSRSVNSSRRDST